MSTKIMSVKGELVDFDLLAIKSQIAESPRTEDVVERERFIDKKRRRGGRKINQMLAEQSDNKKYAESMIDANRKASAAEKASPAEPVNSQTEEIPDTVVQPVTKSTRKLR